MQLDPDTGIAKTIHAQLPPPVGERARRSGNNRILLAALLGCDVLAAMIGWSITWWISQSTVNGPAFVYMLTSIIVFLAFRQRLYVTRACAVRTVELALIGRVSFRTGLVAGLVLWQSDSIAPLQITVLGTTITFAAIAILRGAYRSVLMAARRDGKYRRPVVVVGTDGVGADLVSHIGRNPAFGYEVLGVVGNHDSYRVNGIEVPYLGVVANTVELALLTGANGAIVSAGAAPTVEINKIIRDLLATGLHVQVTPGLRGFAHRRVTTHDIAYEPLLYLEPAQLSSAQTAVKRAIDMVVAPIVLLAAAPVFVAIAIAIKATSRGPVFFKQTRVGYRARTFTIYKFRTMVDHAEQLSAALEEKNLRDGPLFKMDSDPRVTKVGKVLRATSLDELPQLLNVIFGTMALVGPRPALDSEVTEFDDELLRRFSVRPGMTGLWQLEARDDPSFDAYRRLDIFYVENWSLSLDTAIIIGTIADVIVRSTRGALGASVAN